MTATATGSTGSAGRLKPKGGLNDLSWYEAALEGKNPPVYEDQPQCGYFRHRASKAAPWIAAAIWHHEGKLVCRLAGEMVDAHLYWPQLARNPVAKDDALHWMKNGRWLSEAPPTELVPAADGAVPTSHNEPAPPSSPDAILLRDIETELEKAREWLRKLGKMGIKTAAKAQEAGNIVGTLGKLRISATKLHRQEKAPHLAAGKLVDEKYNPKIKLLDAAERHLTDLAEMFAKAEAHRIETERLKAEAAALKSGEASQAPAEPSEPIRFGGDTGRALKLTTVTRAVITDYAATLKHFADHADVKELIQSLAERKLRGGLPVPGAELVEDKEMRR